MDGSDSGRDLHLAIAGLPFLDGPRRALDEYRCRASVSFDLRGVGPELIWWENFKARLQPKPKFKVVPKPAPTRREEDDISASVDPILDKIAKSGIGSLTPSERRTLDRARNRLLKGSK